MTDQEIEKLLKDVREMTARLEKENIENGKILNKIESEMNAEFPNGFKSNLTGFNK